MVALPLTDMRHTGKSPTFALSFSLCLKYIEPEKYLNYPLILKILFVLEAGVSLHFSSDKI